MCLFTFRRGLYSPLFCLRYVGIKKRANLVGLLSRIGGTMYVCLDAMGGGTYKVLRIINLKNKK